MEERTLNPEIGSTIDSIDTPAVLVDLDKVEANVASLFKRFKDKNVSIRPHLKTTKSPDLARLLVDAGANGVCVAKLSEAEVMAAGGIDNILITTEIVGRMKFERLRRLLETGASLLLVVDSEYGALRINEVARTANTKIPLLIEINVGQDRAGVSPGEPVLSLAKFVSVCEHVELKGVQGYEGHLQLLADKEEQKRRCIASMNVLEECVEELRDSGYTIDIVTTGGTGTAEICATSRLVTEVQPGSFIFMDGAYKRTGADYDIALTVLTTVISRPEKNRAVVDAGLKSLSNDSGNATPRNLPGHSYQHAGDEHGIVESDNGELEVKVGDRIELIPSHIDTTINLHDTYYCHRDGKIVHIWPISARGKVQ